MSLSRSAYVILLMLCMGSILLSCSLTKNAIAPASEESGEKAVPKILFLNFEITRDTVSSAFTARLINKIESEGSLKKEPAQPQQTELGDLELQVLDKNQQVLNTLYISNPLDKVVEFVNDSGELQKNVISLDIAEFSVRFQLEPGTSTTLLKRISGPDSENTILLKTSIL